MEQKREFADGTPWPEWAAKVLESGGIKYAIRDCTWLYWSKGFNSWESVTEYDAGEALDLALSLTSQLEAKTQECEGLREAVYAGWTVTDGNTYTAEDHTRATEAIRRALPDDHYRHLKEDGNV